MTEVTEKTWIEFVDGEAVLHIGQNDPSGLPPGTVMTAPINSDYVPGNAGIVARFPREAA